MASKTLETQDNVTGVHGGKGVLVLRILGKRVHCYILK